MTSREYPDRPLVGVGAVIIHCDDDAAEPRVLLARRGRAPSLGEWSIPGGLVKLGETLEEAVIREVQEETGLRVRVDKLIEVLDRIIYEAPPPTSQAQQNIEAGDAADATGSSGASRAQYHYVIIDYLCVLHADCAPASARASSDAQELRWAARDELAQFRLTLALQRVLAAAFTQPRA